ncbi:CPCC family cysteine-rich protein [Promicromonospora vindobonensis]|uniref:CPCC family cysteine-rich protein n=1 Tax=Promicromonospora vindobonensis TaxID=195748 RepID=A0ABW5VSI8_9MICO
MNARFPCSCCGHLVFDEPPGSHAICGICFWEDDVIQLRWPDWTGGANGPSLIEAQQLYAELGAMEPRFIRLVHEPTDDEPLDADWRAIDLTIDSFEPRDVIERPWPKDGTTLYWWRPTFWRRELVYET